MKSRIKQSWPFLALVLGIIVLSGCSKQSFDKQQFETTASAGLYTSPKIDIVLAQDISLSMQTPLTSIQSQFSNFVNNLDSKWDFHFAVIGLQKSTPMYSRYILAKDCSTVSSSYCLTTSQTSTFVNANPSNGPAQAWLPLESSPGNTDNGFQYIQQNLSDSSMTSTGFLRPDAALAVIVLSNGNDVTGLSYPTDYMDRGDGQMVVNPNSADYINSFNSFQSFLQTVIKAGPGLSAFYSVVATNNYSNCYGGSAWTGQRYMDMSTALNSSYYNLCDNGLANTLSNIKSQLDSMVQAFIFKYVVLTSEPIVSTITIKKNGATIPQDSNNGWTYVGYKQNTPIVEFPQPASDETGYFIELHGSAKYSGNDQITVDYEKQ